MKVDTAFPVLGDKHRPPISQPADLSTHRTRLLALNSRDRGALNVDDGFCSLATNQ
ncbi:hypothetical protein [Xanthomonas campestris]|uniref:hypothetical protein n=1 Tax=Xanthomonas campestris TaxID=339 RepID=UPI002B2397BA|nr:hypothetical protein [Xanthomonas campestris]MEA9921100.1 hypothetical protein [Xanthomonas campestris pv. raphani]